ncbi:unnamed protein product, partial [Ixodes persulcatus]
LLSGTVLCKTDGSQDNTCFENNRTKCRGLGLTGRLAIVTGGASGIGRSVCEVLAREGATVVVADKNRTGSNETIRMLQGSYKGDHRAIYVDVSNSTAVSNLFEEIESLFPKRTISVVVNSAGVSGTPNLIHETCDATFDEAIGTNLRGTFLINRASVRHMLAKNVTDGAIVNIASIMAKTGYPGATRSKRPSRKSDASKGGVVSLTKAVALKVATKSIRVNTILPGPVDTPMLAKTPAEAVATYVQATALKRVGQPEEIAETIAFMCSPKSSFMTGAAVDVTGGIIAA